MMGCVLEVDGLLIVIVVDVVFCGDCCVELYVCFVEFEFVEDVVVYCDVVEYVLYVFE